MGTDIEMQNYLDSMGLDPIGSGDMFTFCLRHIRCHSELSVEEVWDICLKEFGLPPHVAST